MRSIGDVADNGVVAVAHVVRRVRGNGSGSYDRMLQIKAERYGLGGSTSRLRSSRQLSMRNAW